MILNLKSNVSISKRLHCFLKGHSYTEFYHSEKFAISNSYREVYRIRASFVCGNCGKVKSREVNIPR